MIYRYRDMIYGLRRMIYLLRKYDIISVPSYAEGIYHRSYSDIISKIYHPFRQERISLKKRTFVGRQKFSFSWRRWRDSNSRRRFSVLHDFQSCALDQLRDISVFHYSVAFCDLSIISKIHSIVKCFLKNIRYFNTDEAFLLRPYTV